MFISHIFALGIIDQIKKKGKGKKVLNFALFGILDRKKHSQMAGSYQFIDTTGFETVGKGLCHLRHGLSGAVQRRPQSQF